ncbi:MAG TPA: PilZ domain-containing protein [Myxococcota bacterium]|nr:PilZ domain-containing protein [Myxococcota bacterium]
MMLARPGNGHRATAPDSFDGLLQAFESLNERKRLDQHNLSKTEKARWRMMRCQIEEALFQQIRDPATDTREFLRVPISLKVCYDAGGKKRKSYLTVLGEGGLFIADSDPEPLGSRLQIEGYPVGRGAPFRVLGEVVWSKGQGSEQSRGIGMGIKFVELGDNERRLVNALVDDRVRQGLLERRRFARIDTRLEVSLSYASSRISALTHDLCIGGMFVTCDLPAPVGTRLAYKLSVPGGLPTDEGMAEVVHRTEKTAQGVGQGIGLAFILASLENEHVIRSYLRRRVAGEIRHPNDEPRRHARLIRRTKVRFQAENGFGTTDARDIGCGGIFLQSRMPPCVGSRIEMSLVDPYTLKTLEMSGRVVRVIQPDPRNPSIVPGVGVAADSGDAASMDLLREILTNLAEMETFPAAER